MRDRLARRVVGGWGQGGEALSHPISRQGLGRGPTMLTATHAHTDRRMSRSRTLLPLSHTPTLLAESPKVNSGTHPEGRSLPRYGENVKIPLRAAAKHEWKRKQMKLTHQSQSCDHHGASPQQHALDSRVRVVEHRRDDHSAQRAPVPHFSGQSRSRRSGKHQYFEALIDGLAHVFSLTNRTSAETIF